jgi:hypothetical protein
MIRILAFTWALICGLCPVALAFNGITHQQITKSAFRYLDGHLPLSPATTQWLRIGNQKRGTRPVNELERLLARASVEADYQADLWMSAWYHRPFAGGKTEYLGMLTSLYHFTNVTRPGLHWTHDGYAYRNTDGLGNDAYLGMVGMQIRGDLSSALGGKAPEGVRGTHDSLASYRVGFKGSEEEWQNSFGPKGRAAKAVLPPSYIPAQLAYQEMLDSPRAQKDHVETWQGLLPVADGYIFMQEFVHHYRRDELDGLPRALDKLGVTLHIDQDLGVPHHAQGLAGYCHPEFEEFVERLSCPSDQVFDFSGYETGNFEQPLTHECQKLYDPGQVESMMANWAALNPNNNMSISERLIEVGKISARWRWGKMSQATLNTLLPNKTLVSAEECKDIFADPGVVEQAKFQYNLVVAATVVIFEVAARQYEQAHNLVSVLDTAPLSQSPIDGSVHKR